MQMHNFLNSLKRKKNQYEELLDLIKEEEGVEQPAAEAID